MLAPTSTTTEGDPLKRYEFMRRVPVMASKKGIPRGRLGHRDSENGLQLRDLCTDTINISVPSANFELHEQGVQKPERGAKVRLRDNLDCEPRLQRD